MAFIYEQVVDPEAGNNAHAFALGMVGFNKAVLEFGCAAGHVTKALVDRGCRVVGVEVDPEAARAAEVWAEEVVVGHVEHDDVWDHLSAEKFDAVLFGDILEHLSDPLTTLRTALRFISPSGFVVLSIPNVAHGDVRLSLLRGSFEYSERGLLDRTHLHFFTKDSLMDLCRQAGLAVVDIKRVVVPLFQSELGVRRDDFDQGTIDRILEDPEAESYQFVVKAVVDNGDQALSALSETIVDLSDQVRRHEVEAALLRAELRNRDELAEEVRHLRILVRERDRLALQVKRLQSAAREREQLALKVTELEGELLGSDREIEAIYATRTFRYLAPLRRVYGRVIRLGRRRRLTPRR